MSKKRDDDIKDLVSSVNKIKKWKNRIIFSVIGIAVVGVIIIFLVILIGSETDEIVTAYNNLSGKPYDSKQQFGARNVKITKDNNGKLQIELVMGSNKNDSDLNGTSDSDPGTPDGDVDSGNSDISNGSNPGNTGGTDAGPEPPKEINATDEDVISFFQGKGYSRDIAIGIAANLRVESGYNISATNGKHTGIAQWDNGRWAAYKSYLKQIDPNGTLGEVGTLGTQLEFVYMEMNNISPATDQYSSKLSVSNFSCAGKYHAAKIVAKFFERCPKPSTTISYNSSNADAYPDSKFESTCQGGKDRLDWAHSMN